MSATKSFDVAMEVILHILLLGFELEKMEREGSWYHFELL